MPKPTETETPRAVKSILGKYGWQSMIAASVLFCTIVLATFWALNMPRPAAVNDLHVDAVPKGNRKFVVADDTLYARELTAALQRDSASKPGLQSLPDKAATKNKVNESLTEYPSSQSRYLRYRELAERFDKAGDFRQRKKMLLLAWGELQQSPRTTHHEYAWLSHDISFACFELNEFEESGAWSQRTLAELAEAADADEPALAVAHYTLALDYHGLKEWDLAAEEYRLALPLVRKHEFGWSASFMQDMNTNEEAAKKSVK